MNPYPTSSKKRLCFLIQSHYSHTMGGVESQAKLVIESLSRQKEFDIYYLCRNTDPEFVPEEYKIEKIGNLMGKYFLYFDSYSLYRSLRKINPDIIYQNGGFRYVGIAALYARYFRASLIWHIASDGNVEPQRQNSLKAVLKNSVDQIMLNYGIRKAETIVGQTKRQNNLLKSRFGRNCDEFIQPGHPLADGKIAKARDLTVLWIGNFRPVKRPELFVKLARCFQNRHHVSFVMIGGTIGPRAQSNKIIEEIMTVPNLNYLGSVSQDEVNQRLREGHILINTSRYEGFPNTFIQAWLREVPVVSLNINPDDILSCEKIGFCSKSFQKLVIDVVTLIENKTLREEMGRKARIYAEKNHAADKMIEKLVKLFKLNQHPN